jgi:hypothetical protein
MKYTKEQAILVANTFIKEMNVLEKKHNMSIGSDSGDIYLSFKIESNDEMKIWDTVSLGWDGDGSGIKVTEEIVISNEEKIIYWAKQLENKSLSLHELVENAKWLLEHVK